MYHAVIGGYIQNAEVCKESGFNVTIGKLLPHPYLVSILFYQFISTIP